MPFTDTSKLLDFYKENKDFFLQSFIDPDNYQNKVLPANPEIQRLQTSFADCLQMQAGLKLFNLAAQIYYADNYTIWMDEVETLTRDYIAAMVGPDYPHKAGGLLAGDMSLLTKFINNNLHFFKFMNMVEEELKSTIKTWRSKQNPSVINQVAAHTFFYPVDVKEGEMQLETLINELEIKDKVIFKKYLNANLNLTIDKIDIVKALMQHQPMLDLVNHFIKIIACSRNQILNQAINNLMREIFEVCFDPNTGMQNIQKSYNRIKSIAHNDPLIINDDLIKALSDKRKIIKNS